MNKIPSPSILLSILLCSNLCAMRQEMSLAQHKMLGVVQNRYVAVKAGPHTMLTHLQTLKKVELFNRELDFTQRAITTMGTSPNGIRFWNINPLIAELNSTSDPSEQKITSHHIPTFLHLAGGNRVDQNLSNGELITQLRLADFFNSDSAKKTIEKECANKITIKQIVNYVFGKVESSDDLLPSVMEISSESPAFKNALWYRFFPTLLRKKPTQATEKEVNEKEFPSKDQKRYFLNKNLFLTLNGNAALNLWDSDGPKNSVGNFIADKVLQVRFLGENKLALNMYGYPPKVEIHNLSMPKNTTTETIFLAHILDYTPYGYHLVFPSYMMKAYENLPEYVRQLTAKHNIKVQEKKKESRMLDKARHFFTKCGQFFTK